MDKCANERGHEGAWPHHGWLSESQRLISGGSGGLPAHTWSPEAQFNKEQSQADCYSWYVETLGVHSLEETNSSSLMCVLT